MWDKLEQHIADTGSWRPALQACPDAADLQLERPKLEAGEPWHTTQLAGLQFYRYNSPGLDEAPVRPDVGERLHLVRRPDNPADGNAVEVWLRNEHMLGHIPRDLAARIVPELDQGISLRAYALGPGTGDAWSVRTLLVGAPASEDYERWLREQAQQGEWALHLTEHAVQAPRKARGLAFVQRQQQARAARLQQAVRTFEALPLDAALVPLSGEEYDAWWLAQRLGMSETLLARLVREAGAGFLVHMRGCYASRPRSVVITAALRDALLAWCAAPTARVSLGALARAIRSRRR